MHLSKIFRDILCAQFFFFLFIYGPKGLCDVLHCVFILHLLLWALPFRTHQREIESDGGGMWEPAYLVSAMIVNMGCRLLLNGFMEKTQIIIKASGYFGHTFY